MTLEEAVDTVGDEAYGWEALKARRDTEGKQSTE
jgi:hypothetical protein